MWNNHGYATDLVYRLLDGVVDVYVTDFKFGPDTCDRRVAGARDYWLHAKRGVELMAAQDARIIIRILVMPGHVECCHEPALELLAGYRERVWLSFVELSIDG